MRGVRRRQAGLTLVELMVVLTIMGAVVGAALPTMSEAMADRRVSVVARDVVRLFRHARYASQAYGRAHLVRYQNDGILGLLAQSFVFETIRGDMATCFLTRLFHRGSAGSVPMFDCGNQPECVDAIYANEYDPDPTDDDVIRVDGVNQLGICYESGASNQIYEANFLIMGWLSGSSSAGRGFLVYRTRGGGTNNVSPVGVQRKVLVPIGTGAPRVMR